MANLHAVARNEIAYLKKYLSMSEDDMGRDLAHMGSFLMREWADEHGIELDGDPEEDPEAAYESLDQADRKAWKEWVSTWFLRNDPVSAPTYVSMSLERFFRNEWLVHFTDHGDAIISEGFTKGIANMEALALTRYMRDVAKSHPGYVFAYEADAVPHDGDKYGSEVVLFQGTGVVAHHYGDEERQAIVWGPSAYNLTLLKQDRNTDCWLVEGKRGDPVYTSRKSDRAGLNEAIAWVQAHRQQYRKALAAAGEAISAALGALKRAPSGDDAYEWRLAAVRPTGQVHKEKGTVMGKMPAVMAIVSALRKLRLQGYQAQAAVLIPTLDGRPDPERQREAVDLDLLTLDQRQIQLKLATGKGLKPLAA